MIKKKYIEFIFLIGLGAITSLSLPPLNFYVINFITLSLFFIFIVKKRNFQKNHKLFFFYGWLFGFGYFLSNLYWISISLTFDEDFRFLSKIIVFLLPAFFALFYGLITLLFLFFKTNNILSSFLIFSLIFGILEFIRGSILTGFPWNLFAYSFSNETEILILTSLIGTYGFNLLCISLFITPGVIFLREGKKDIFICLLFLIIFLFSFIYGSFNKEKFNGLDSKKLDYKLRVVGSNISLDRFYKKLDTAQIIDDLINLSSPKTSEKTIFLWPEGILPNISQENLRYYEENFKKRFNKNHLLILGINKEDKTNNSIKYFNSLSIFNNNLELIDSYNKVNLVPFGEFLPIEGILKKIGLKSLTNNYQSYTSGEQRDIIEIKIKNFSLKVLPLICYEIIYSGKLFKDSNFDLIINISEDGWFGKSIGPKQHFAHSIFRAIESGKYLLRSSNNGIAAIVNPIGGIEKKVSFGNSGYLDFNEYKEVEQPFFSKIGNKIFGFLILLYISFIFSFNRNN